MKRPEFYVSVSPHIHSGYTVQKMIFETVAALIPAFLAGVFFFRGPALKIILISVFAALATEYLWQRFIRPPVRVQDGSAVLTGLLLGLLLSTMSPWWLPALGAVVAIIVGKQVFGGLGNHPFNAALVGWTFLQVSYRELMEDTPLPDPLFLLEPGEFLAYSPLFTLRDSGIEGIEYVPWLDFILGNLPGSIGTVSVLAVLIGGGYLLFRRIITWHIPVSFLASAWIFAFIFWRIDPEVYANPTFHIFSGWIMLGAFFLAPEKGTAPVTVPGMIVYGVGCGIITMIIRIWGVYAEGVPFAILLMNAMTPLLDRMRPRVVGRAKEIA
jgi:electron transport complex protein RnfD